MAQQLQRVAANVETLVTNSAKQLQKPESSSSHVVNLLYENQNVIHTKALPLDFSKFDGTDLMGQAYPANQFFAYHQTNAHHHVLLASFHMKGKALVRFQDHEASGTINSWDGLVHALQTWFGPTAYEDPMEALTRLRQITTVGSYKSDFEYLSNQLRCLVEPYKLSCFLSKLREDIQFMVRMFNPPTLHIAFGLAKMQEENIVALKKNWLEWD